MLAAEFTDDQIEAAILDALRERKFEPIPGLVALLALRDPARAQRVLDALNGMITLEVAAMSDRVVAGEPTQTCRLCGRVEVVRPDGRGFPPDIAKRRLQKACRAAGCTCDPAYRAGFNLRVQTTEETPDDHT